MTTSTIVRRSLLALVLCACAPEDPTDSQSFESEEAMRPPLHPPPPEAIAACEGASPGDACSFTHDDRTLDGKCIEGPDADAPLACAPPPPPCSDP